MLDLMGERYFQIAVAANVDRVFAAIDIPAGCVLKSVNIKAHMTGASPSIEREIGTGYAVGAYQFPVEDPDSRVDPDVLWDRFVPKYTDVDVVDLDTNTAVSTPFWEPGEASFEDVYDMGNRPIKTFGRKKLLTFADPGNAGMKFVDQATPFEPQWIAADNFGIKLNRPIMRAHAPSVWMAAIASPNWDDTTGTYAQLAEEQWGIIQYAGDALSRALMDQLSLTEAGATQPYQKMSDTLRAYLAPNVFEETGSAWSAQQMNLFGSINWTLQVPGEIKVGAIDLTP